MESTGLHFLFWITRQYQPAEEQERADVVKCRMTNKGLLPGRGRIPAFFLLLVFSVGLISCTKRQAVRPLSLPEYAGPVDIEVLRENLAFRGMQSVKSEVSVVVLREGDRLGKYKGIFAYRAPDSMRLRLLSPMGVTGMEFVMSGEYLQVYLSGKNAIYEGKAPSLAMPANAFYGLEREGGSYILYAFKPTGGVMELAGKFSFDARTLRNTGMTVYHDGRRYMGILFGDMRGEAPEFMRLSFFNGFAMEMTLNEPVVNAEIAEKYFAPLNRDGKAVYPIQSLLESQ